jgi:putative DNA primase/helicase
VGEKEGGMKTADAARGKWIGILTHFGIEEGYLRDRHGPCPMCGGADRFRFDNKDGNGTWICNQCGAGGGMKLLMEVKGWDFKAAAAEVDRIVGNVTETETKTQKQDPAIRINKVAASLKPLSDAVRAYLANRNLKGCKGIQSAPVDYYEDGKRLETYECMVCPVTNPSGDVISFHITYLKDGKKAPVKNPKKMLSPLENLSGAAIRLTGIYPTIGIAEGIETALAVMEIYKMPCWAAANATMMQAFVPPEGVTGVIIYADNDANFTGQKAAYTLANRLALAGYTVGVFAPIEIGDFADVLKPNSVIPSLPEKEAA